jgi:outer membrane receptor for ferrienterochelin and colicins
MLKLRCAVLSLCLFAPDFAGSAEAAGRAEGEVSCQLSGIVRDMTGFPLPGATVSLRVAATSAARATPVGKAASGGKRADGAAARGDGDDSASAAAAAATAVSDERGRYCLSGVEPGAYLVDAALEGFRPVLERVVLHDLPPAGSRGADPGLVTGANAVPGPASGAATATGAGSSAKAAERVRATAVRGVSLDFALSPGLTQEVVVTATRTSRRLDDVPVRTEVIGRDAINATAARTLADAVEFTTGVRVENNCQNCNFSQIRLLGLEGPYTQILIDGQPIISSLAQVYGIEQLPARMIERIEVVKGGGSALYGPGAVGGVVNVIPREPARSGGTLETRTDIVGGLPNYSVNGALDWVAPDRRTFVTTFAQVDRVKPVDLTGDGFTEVSRRSLEAFGARANRYVLDGRAKLTAEATRMTEDRRGGDLLRLPPQQANIAEWIDTRRTAGSLSWFHTVSRAFDYRVTFALADTSRDSYYGTGQDPNAFGQTTNQLSVVDSQLNHYAGAHTLSWGLQASWEDLLDRQPAYDRLTDARYRNTGLFLQDDWGFAKGWQLLYGLRVDKHSAVSHVITSPRVALMYSPTSTLDIRASVARGFRAPQAFDEDLHLSSVGGEVRFIRLSPRLKEETSGNTMLGAEWKPTIGGGQALFEANVFYTSLTDLFNVQLDDDPATPMMEMLKVNFGGARVYGTELNAGWGMGDEFVIQGGVVLQRARFETPEPIFGSRDFFRTPSRYGNLSITLQRDGLASLFVGLRYTGSMRAPHYAGFIDENRLETTRRFLTVDASVSRPVRLGGGRGARQIVFTVGAKNLTNAYQDDLDQGPLRDSDYVYGPRFPRSITAGMRVEF